MPPQMITIHLSFAVTHAYVITNCIHFISLLAIQAARNSTWLTCPQKWIQLEWENNIINDKVIVIKISLWQKITSEYESLTKQQDPTMKTETGMSILDFSKSKSDITSQFNFDWTVCQPTKGNKHGQEVEIANTFLSQFLLKKKSANFLCACSIILTYNSYTFQLPDFYSLDASLCSLRTFFCQNL